MPLPSATTKQDWSALLRDDAALRPGVAAIAQRHGLGSAPVQRYASGSLPVYALGDRHVLKLYPPHEASFAAVEARVLEAVAGALPIATPQPLAVDSLESWHYILMSQLRGQRLVDVWREIGTNDRDKLAEQLGTSLAALHALDVAALADIEPHWPAFIQAQRRSAVERQRARGLAPQWLDQVAEFLDAWMPAVTGKPALLHTEVMREHLTVEQGSNGWRLTGLFDFEPAMLGDPDYEFASVGLFVSCGDGRFLRRLLRAYGKADTELDATLQCRFMAHAILHRYSNLSWYLERLPAQRETTLAQLAAHWWAFD